MIPLYPAPFFKGISFYAIILFVCNLIAHCSKFLQGV